MPKGYEGLSKTHYFNEEIFPEYCRQLDSILNEDPFLKSLIDFKPLPIQKMIDDRRAELNNRFKHIKNKGVKRDKINEKMGQYRRECEESQIDIYNRIKEKSYLLHGKDDPAYDQHIEKVAKAHPEYTAEEIRDYVCFCQYDLMKKIEDEGYAPANLYRKELAELYKSSGYPEKTYSMMAEKNQEAYMNYLFQSYKDFPPEEKEIYTKDGTAYRVNPVHSTEVDHERLLGKLYYLYTDSRYNKEAIGDPKSRNPKKNPDWQDDVNKRLTAKDYLPSVPRRYRSAAEAQIQQNIRDIIQKAKTIGHDNIKDFHKVDNHSLYSITEIEDALLDFPSYLQYRKDIDLDGFFENDIPFGNTSGLAAYKENLQKERAQIEKELDELITHNEFLNEYASVPKPVMPEETGGDAFAAYEQNEKAYNKAMGLDGDYLPNLRAIDYKLLIEADKLAKESGKYTSEEIQNWVLQKHNAGLQALNQVVDPENIKYDVPPESYIDKGMTLRLISRRLKYPDLHLQPEEFKKKKEENRRKAEEEAKRVAQEKAALEAKQKAEAEAEAKQKAEAERLKRIAEEKRKADEEKRKAYEAADKKAAPSIKEELERLRGRLAINSRAKAAMTGMRNNLSEALSSINKINANELKSADISNSLKKTLASARAYQNEKTNQDGSFSSTQIHRLKTINYILALDHMAKQDPPMDPKSPEGERFMLAVKIRNDMSMANPKNLCNGDKIIEQAEALVKEPVFEKFIKGSKKSVNELRKIKSVTVAQQFSKCVNEYNASNSKQDANAPANKISVASKAKNVQHAENLMG